MNQSTLERKKTQQLDPFGMPISKQEWKQRFKKHLPLRRFHEPRKPIVVRHGLTKTQANTFMNDLYDSMTMDGFFNDLIRRPTHITGRRGGGIGNDVEVWVSVGTDGLCAIIDISPRHTWPDLYVTPWMALLRSW